MDIERIQKINTLALDLVKKGLAASQDEAIAQAEKIFRVREDDVTFTRSNMQDNSLQVSTNESGAFNTAVSSNDNNPLQENNSPPSLQEDQIKEILEKNTTFLVSKIRDFTAKIEDLHQEVALLKRQMASRPTPSNIQQTRQTSVQDNASEKKQDRPAQSSPPPSSPSQENHPRSGIFGDTDVSIEKFFYAGNK
tara:strand:- start:68 stop:649 length:582 start_codon:yes stop_codon:yes gene_type:complete